MGNSAEARRLHVQLAAETGVPVEVQWDSSGSARGRQWHIIWYDGPTPTGMAALVDRLLSPTSTLDRDTLVYLRTIRPVTVALAVVRNLRLGQPPLGEHQDGWNLEDHLLETPYPERGTDDDLELAAELSRIADFGDAQTIADHADRYGLAGLRVRLTPADNVLVFRRPDRP